jgi:pimeloyl-ACP methyl ester carboxylesterase
VTILALHGNGGGANRFALLRAFLPPDVQLEALTLPGFAAEPLLPHLRTMADFASHVARIARYLPRPLVLLGHGIGGSLALEFAQGHASLIDGLLLHAPVGARLDRRWFPRLMSPRWVRRTGQRAFASPWLRPLWRRLLFSRPVAPHILDRFFDEYRHAEAFSLMFDLITPAWFVSLQPTAVPATLLWGRRERVLDPSQAAEFERLLLNGRSRVVPEWDHFPMLEQPEEYAREIVAQARQLVQVEVPTP